MKNQILPSLALCTLALTTHLACTGEESKKPNAVENAQGGPANKVSTASENNNSAQLDQNPKVDNALPVAPSGEIEAPVTVTPTEAISVTPTPVTPVVVAPEAPVVIAPEVPVVVAPEVPVVIAPDPINPGLLITADRPLKTVIRADVNPATDWEYHGLRSGREYWLHSTRGRYMTFNPKQNYEPYNDQTDFCAELTEDPNSACSVKPSNVAQECQRIASSTLKAIMDKPPSELLAMRSNPVYGGSFIMFGWTQDAYSDREHAASTNQSLFIWRSGKDSVSASACPSDFKKLSDQYTYLKWVSSVSKDGECKSPSLGQFKAILKSAKSCLEKNNNIAH